MLPRVAKRDWQLKAAKAEVYTAFHPGKSAVACTSLLQISDVLHGKTLNIWHDLRSSFWKRFLRRCPYLICFEHLLSGIGLIWWGVGRELCSSEWSNPSYSRSQRQLWEHSPIHTFFSIFMFTRSHPLACSTFPACSPPVHTAVTCSALHSCSGLNPTPLLLALSPASTPQARKCPFPPLPSSRIIPPLHKLWSALHKLKVKHNLCIIYN